MTAAVLDDAPTVARVGFDHGWYLCGPTFLKLGIPLLIIDQLFLADPTTFGLEHLSGRDPHTPLPLSTLTVQRSGRFVALYTSDHAEPLTISAFADPDRRRHLDIAVFVAVAVGDTWAMERSWCALFDAAIGIAPISRFTPGTHACQQDHPRRSTGPARSR